jgi:hypothetical protein
MKPIDLSLDPSLMQTLAEQAKADSTHHTASDLHDLQKKRKANTKPSLRQTRDQRAFDVRVKSLKPDDDRLRKLRSLQMGNYFVVPVSELQAVRNMTSRELRERGIKYVTTKFTFGRAEYVKVLRYNPIHDSE